ncbi:hypothetical protein JXA88_10440 [Candidatus Fermentibacteria bacterium]|nr:hypothetical protein [Candidatus Fermentibacteria bacterium]
MNWSRTPLLSIMALLVVLGAAGNADIPQVISYQGKVTDTSGNPVANGSYSMRFRIYNAATGGSLMWDSGAQPVTITGGIFSVLLGESPQPVLTASFSSDYWLLVTVQGIDQSPRQRMASVGYAYMASGLVPGTEVSGAVTSGICATIAGTNTATIGMGVYGSATATTGATYGVFGQSSSSSGIGVQGTAPSATGSTSGVLGISSSSGGYGVWGIAGSTTGNARGVFGYSAANSGRGVYGLATNASGMTYGVYGESASTSGTGVYGFANATTGTTYGVHGRSDAVSGRGVYGWVNSTTGTNYGVYGTVLSPSGYGGYFSGRLATLANINGDATPANHVALIQNTSSGTSPDVLALKVGYTGNPSSAVNYITFFKGNDAAVGAIEGNGAGGVTLLSGGADFAEYLPLLYGENLEAGDVVGVFDGGVAKRTEGASAVMVVSTRPIVVGNSPREEKSSAHARVAFIGQVEVKVRGPVTAGDLLIPSGLGDGIAVARSRQEIRAAQFGAVFGQAWEGTADNGVTRVRAAVGLMLPDPTVARLESELRATIADLQARLTALEQMR